MLRRILFLIPGLLLAHPMGNFSVSHYTRIEVGARGVSVRYALDLAEVPTFELLRDWKLDAASPRADLEAKAASQMRAWMERLDFRAGGAPVPAKFEGADLVISDGAAGLPVMRITGSMSVVAAPGALTFEDRNFAERAGWKEIVIAGVDGAAITKASQSSEERSKGLTAYPADPLVAPPQDLRASLTWTAQPSSPIVGAAKPASPVIAPIEQPKPTTVAQAAPAASNPGAAKSAGEVTKGDYLSRMLGNRELTPWMLFVGLLVAFGIGAVHATSPGHGKTLVAAYLVGSKGTMKHAAILGAMTTFTHTVSVFALGLVTLFLSQYILPETLLPWLGAISGLSIVLVGGSLFFKRVRKLRAAGASHVHTHAHHDHDHAHLHATGQKHDHDHAHIGHSHDHKHDRWHSHDHPHTHPHSHSHDHPQTHGHTHDRSHKHVHDHGDGKPHSHEVPEEITMASLLALGASGGLVPCPSALVLLLTSIALGRVGLGLALLTSFSLGLATVLVGIGVLVLYAKSLLPKSKTVVDHPAFKFVPVLSAAVIVIIGFLMTGVSLGWVKGFSA